MTDLALLRRQASETLRKLQRNAWWKPNKAEQHLAKRRAMGHLSDEATVGDYDDLVSLLLNGRDNSVYHYRFGTSDYYAVAGTAHGVAWLAILSANGMMETAFPPDDLAGYLVRHGFVRLGSVGEIGDE